MDRKAWLAVSLSVLGLIYWFWHYGISQPKPALPPAPANAHETAAAAPAPQPETPAPAPPVPAMTSRSESLLARGQKDEAEFVFSNDTGGIERVILRMHVGENDLPVQLNGDAAAPIGAIYTDPTAAERGFAMRADQEHGEVVFTRQDADGLAIEKKFTLPGEGVKASPYAANMELTFRNTSQTRIERKGFFIGTGSAAPIHEKDLSRYMQFDWSRNGKVKNITTDWFNASSFLGLFSRPERHVFDEPQGPITWTSVASQYFCILLIAQDAQGSSAWATRFDIPAKENGRLTHGIRGAMGMAGFSLEPGQSLTQKFEIYAGPKELARLDSLKHNAEAVLNFGWFGFISKFLLWAMNALHTLVGSYAAAIILLTLLIKSALWPIQNKATNSMRRMSLLSPKMSELREKYKDDPTKMNEELMKLYRDYGINPFSGCLPMLIQIPIFFGFYAMLGSAIQLRNSSFLWIHDLSQPDTVAHLLGFPVNVLPLLMAATMVWQMVITPKTGDPSQQRIMMFMPIIFVVFAYNYASALSLYWTTQNLFSIVQLYLTRNRPLPTLEKVRVPAKRNTGRKRRSSR